MKILPTFAFLIIILLLVSGCSAPITGNRHTTTPSTTTVIPVQAVTQSSTFISSPGNMTISFIDVGQGDSELIQSPSGKSMLIDAGTTGTGSKVVLHYLQDEGISIIDVVVATHPHEDHIGGMTMVLNTFVVKQFVDSGYPHTTIIYKNMLNLIDKKNIAFQTVKNGDIISLDPAVSIQVLNPQSTFSDDINQNSIVLKITYGNNSFLFTGDAGEPVENRYASIAGHVDILKVSHHGSSTSTGSAFLSKTTPSVSVIEVGAGNTYGHPTAAALRRLQRVGSVIYRTDLDGTIKITSDGNTYSVIKG